MTQGQMMFLSGVVLLITTIVLGIVFLIKKPRYSPEQFDGTGSGAIARFRNGYPTDRLTKRYPSVSEAPVQPTGVEEETEHLSESAELGEDTERLQEMSEFCVGEVYPQELDLAEETEPLQGSFELSEKTERLTAATEFGEATVPLQETGDLPTQMKSTGEETQKLNEDD